MARSIGDIVRSVGETRSSVGDVVSSIRDMIRYMFDTSCTDEMVSSVRNMFCR